MNGDLWFENSLVNDFENYESKVIDHRSSIPVIQIIIIKMAYEKSGSDNKNLQI